MSWLRDANFWKDGGRRLGINFQRVCIVDALSNGLGFGPDSVDKTEETIFKAINDTTAAGKGEGEILLVLDGLDFLLAASGCPAVQILEMIGELREVCALPHMHPNSDLLTSTLQTARA